MTKRPDQHNLDQNESQATDYKFRRQTQDQNRRGPEAETVEGGRGNAMTPRETMNARARQSEEDRERELERAAGVKERGEGNHPSSAEEYEPEGDRSEARTSGAGPGSRETRDESLGESGTRTHEQSASARTAREERSEGSQRSERAEAAEASQTSEGPAQSQASDRGDRSERMERDMRDREELGRQDVSGQSRGMAEDVEQRRQREAEENELR